MKITIIQGAFFPVPPLLGGAVEKIWFRLGQEFASLGHEVTHISRSYGELPDEEIIKGVRHVRVPGFDQPPTMIKLKALDLVYSYRACRKAPLNSDVVVTNTFWSPWLLPKTLRPKAYVDVQRVPKRQMRWYVSAGRLRACSKAIEVAIRAELPANRHRQVSYIPNPFPFDPPSDSERVPKSGQILYCGRIHPEKGIETLLAACAGLSWPTAVVGPQDTTHGGGGLSYCDELRARATKLGRTVTFYPPVFDVATLNQLYNKATIFVYPSIAERGDAAPVAPREAMAWGCVPVVSDLECFKDVIRHEHNGLIFNHKAADPVCELATALRRLTDDAALRAHLATEAIKVCQTHSPQHIARLFLDDFADALSGTAPGG